MEQNETIGTILKNQRKKKKISLDEIAESTKININILKALEADDFKNLPNKTYIRGFVINYAKTIGLDVNEARASLENTYHIKYGHLDTDLAEQKKTYLDTSTNTNNPEQDENETDELKETLISIIQDLFNKKIIYSLIGLVIVFIIGKTLVTFFSQLNFESNALKNTTSTSVPAKDILLKSKNTNLFDIQATKKMEVMPETVTATKETAKKIPKAEVVTKPVEKAKEEKNIVEAKIEKVKEDEVEIKEEKKKEAPKKLIAGKFPYKKFSPAPAEIYDIIKDSPEAKNTDLLPQYIKNAVIKGKQNVYIVALEDSWISFQINDQKIKRYVLKKGRHTLLKGERVLLFVGNYNALKVFLNNDLVSAQSKTGVKSFIFPETEATNYVLPLFPSFNGVPYTSNEYKENMAQELSVE
ncbi:MAG: hypothetical protein HON90_15405 [Halobacteriovoraceae bacterium]|jgi:cytoskeleton protein RodZ|nr:hypothetical protein [Halobacteriovoraceae bacterium]